MNEICDMDLDYESLSGFAQNFPKVCGAVMPIRFLYCTYCVTKELSDCKDRDAFLEKVRSSTVPQTVRRHPLTLRSFRSSFEALIDRQRGTKYIFIITRGAKPHNGFHEVRVYGYNRTAFASFALADFSEADDFVEKIDLLLRKSLDRMPPGSGVICYFDKVTGAPVRMFPDPV